MRQFGLFDFVHAGGVDPGRLERSLVLVGEPTGRGLLRAADPRVLVATGQLVAERFFWRRRVVVQASARSAKLAY